MHGELEEILEFIKSIRPFDELSHQQLKLITRALHVRYFKREQHILDAGQQNNMLFILHTGAVDIFDAQQQFSIRVEEKGCFGYLSLLHNTAVANTVISYEDSLVYCLPADVFKQICSESKQLEDYFLLAEAQRLRKVISTIHQTTGQANSALGITVAKIINRPAVTINFSVSIQKAVELMAQENVSTIMVVDEDDKLSGIFTDRDLRNRVVAAKVGLNELIDRVMSKEIISIEPNMSVFEAGLLMMRHNIHSLPIVTENKPIGLISTTDLLKLTNQNPVFTVAEISKAADVSQLSKISRKIPQVLTNLVASGIPAHQVGRLISTLGEYINIQLIKLAEQKFGKPPIEYCWLSAGSLGRQEQLLHSDQDNVLLLSNEYNHAKHGQYFAEFSQFVCDGLNDCGYVYCPGNVMATNDEWCQPLKQWKKYFTRWINEPEPKALMYCSIFFDMRVLYGKQKLFKKLKKYYLDLVVDNKMFLSHLSANTLHHTPPLGFFRQFVLVGDKEHKDKLNLKKRGTVPIVDLARVYALSAGIDSINTYQRIVDAKSCGVISEEVGNNLLDAYEFINYFRMQHQASQISQQCEPDNFANPDELSSFEKDHLHDAFKIVSQAQTYLQQRYITGQMR